MSSLFLGRSLWSNLAKAKLRGRLHYSAAAATAIIRGPSPRELSIESQWAPHGSDPTNKWKDLQDRPLSAQSLDELLNNRIPTIRVPQFLSKQECKRMVDVISSHKVGTYNKDVFPVIGSVGITQFDYKKDKAGYFGAVEEAYTLQRRLSEEAGVPVVERVRSMIEAAAGIPVRVATEGDATYFAGLLRVINSSALIHSDYAPYDAPDWTIGRIVSQITWNVLLKQVDGGESVVYNRSWQGPADDEVYKRTAPSYGYQTLAVENKEFKVIPAVEGDLTLMNSRNFHEVRPLDRANEESRYTMSSFVGLLPTSAGLELVLWS